MKLLTNLLFEPKGKHDPALAYNIKDTVMSADGSKVYFALQDVPAGTALSNGDYWKLQIDLSSSKSAMDQALASFADYAKVIGMRVRGETAKASGNPVTFLPDAGSLLQPVTVLEPQQQGSGEPYPAGGGKNLADAKLYNVQFVVANVYLVAGRTYALSVANTPTGLFFSSVDMATNYSVNYGAKSLIYTVETSGEYLVRAYYQNNDASLDCHMQLELGSAATDYAPYSNIRPITGYDAVKLNHAGENLLNNVRYYDNTHTDIRAQYDAPLLLKAGVKYVLSTNFQADGLFFVDATGNGSLEAQYLLNYQYQTSALEYTPTRDIECLFVAIFNSGVPNGTTIQLEVGSATSHEPYQGNNYTVQIGQTVYGGKFDWLTGKLTAEWMYVGFDGSDILWAANNGGTDTLFYLVTHEHNIIPAAKMGGRCICTHAPTKDAPPVDQIGCCVSATSSSGIIYLNLGVQTGAYGFNQYVAENDVRIAYEPAEPIEIQLTPHIITAADPEQTNTLYGDGRIDVEYVKPLHVSIEERVAAALAAAKE